MGELWKKMFDGEREETGEMVVSNGDRVRFKKIVRAEKDFYTDKPVNVVRSGVGSISFSQGFSGVISFIGDGERVGLGYHSGFVPTTVPASVVIEGGGAGVYRTTTTYSLKKI